MPLFYHGEQFWYNSVLIICSLISEFHTICSNVIHTMYMTEMKTIAPEDSFSNSKFWHILSQLYLFTYLIPYKRRYLTCIGKRYQVIYRTLTSTLTSIYLVDVKLSLNFLISLHNFQSFQTFSFYFFIHN